MPGTWTNTAGHRAVDRLPQHGVDQAVEFLRHEWLSEEAGRAFAREAGGRFLLVEAAREDHFDFGIALPKLAAERLGGRLQGGSFRFVPAVGPLDCSSICSDELALSIRNVPWTLRGVLI